MERNELGFRFERLSTQNLTSMASMHFHQYYELYFLISGQRRYFLGHTIYDIAPGNLVYIPKHILHKTVSIGKKGFDRYVLSFSPKQYGIFAEMAGRDFFSEYPNGECFQFSPDKVVQIQKHFEQMEAAQKGTSRFSQAAFISTFFKLLSDCLCYGNPKPPFQEETADKIQRAAQYISEHYSQWLPLEDVASFVHMEKTYFCRKFKAFTGFGFLDYLTQMRLMAAENLLSETDMPIGKIAEACGFSGSNYFADVFRRHHSVSPSEYRITARKQSNGISE